MDTQNKTGFEVGANINPFEQAMRNMVQSAKGGQGGVTDALGRLATGPLAGLKLAFEVISTILAGGIFKTAIEDTAKMTESAMDLGRSLGVSTNEARAIQIAMDDIGASVGEYEGAAKGLSKRLKENEDGMNQMGLSTRDAAGQLRPMTELVADGIKVLGTYKEGTDRMLASQILFGKGLDASSKLMIYDNQVQEDARQTMEDMGLTVGTHAVAAWQDFDSATDKASFGIQGMKKAIGDSLMPVATTLISVFDSIMPAAIVVTRGALSGLTSGFLFVKNGVLVLWETINAMIYSVVEPLRGLYETLGHAMVGDFSGAANAFKAIGKNVGDVWKGSLDRMAEDSRQTAEQVYNLFSRDDQAGSGGGPGSGNRSYVAPDKKEKTTKDSGLIHKWDAELNAQKQVHADQNAANGTFYEFSKETERAFWISKKSIAEAGSKDAAGVQARLTAITLDMQKNAFETHLAQMAREQADAEQNFTKKIELAQKELALVTQRYGAESKQATDTQKKIEDMQRSARDQRRQLLEADSADAVSRSIQQIDLERQQLQYELDAGLITNAQKIAAEQDFEQRKYEVQAAALALRQASIDPDLNPLEYARIKSEILQLEQQHQLQIGQLRDQAALESSASLRTVFGGIESGWASTIKGIMTGTQSLAQGIQNAFKSVFDSVIGMLSQMVAKWLVQQLVMLAFGKSVATTTVADKAAEAGAGGVASMAAAPFPLNLTAPFFGASMSALALSYGAVASASAGYDIPAGIDPLTQLHAQEMVLPAHIANPLRESLAGDGLGASGDTYNMHFNAVDGQSVARLFRDNGQHLVAALKDQRRNFNF